MATESTTARVAADLAQKTLFDLITDTAIAVRERNELDFPRTAPQIESLARAYRHLIGGQQPGSPSVTAQK